MFALLNFKKYLFKIQIYFISIVSRIPIKDDTRFECQIYEKQSREIPDVFSVVYFNIYNRRLLSKTNLTKMCHQVALIKYLANILLWYYCEFSRQKYDAYYHMFIDIIMIKSFVLWNSSFVISKMGFIVR